MTLILKSFLKWCPVVRSMNWKILCAEKNWPEKSCMASTGWEEGRGHTRVFEQMTMPSFPMLENSELTGTSFSEMHGPEDQFWQCSGPPNGVVKKSQAKSPSSQVNSQAAAGALESGAMGKPKYVQEKVSYFHWGYSDSECSPYTHSATIDAFHTLVSCCQWWPQAEGCCTPPEHSSMMQTIHSPACLCFKVNVTFSGRFLSRCTAPAAVEPQSDVTI